MSRPGLVPWYCSCGSRLFGRINSDEYTWNPEEAGDGSGPIEVVIEVKCRCKNFGYLYKKKSAKSADRNRTGSDA